MFAKTLFTYRPDYDILQIKNIQFPQIYCYNKGIIVLQTLVSRKDSFSKLSI